MTTLGCAAAAATLSLELSERLAPAAGPDAFLHATREMLGAVLPSDVVWHTTLHFDERRAELFGDVDSEACARRVTAAMTAGRAIQEVFDRAPSQRADQRLGPAPAPSGAVVLVPPRLLDMTRWILDAGDGLGSLMPTGVPAAHLAISTHDDVAHRARRGTGWGLVRVGHGFSAAEVDVAVALQPVLALLELAYGGTTAPGSTPGADLRGVERAAVVADLTARELDVLRLLCRGLKAQHIGHVLRISPRTVQKHLQNAYTKLGVHDRLQVADRVRRLGLVDSEHP